MKVGFLLLFCLFDLEPGVHLEPFPVCCTPAR